ncbi:putative cytosolic domain of 10TM putative phosphate transporter [Lyophyllum shimeji]|uniref:Cytosolic domain of 10TM putative phosphate transporter n=1 Tax=Lyophyllum shimeji TaxID=47721 RepID=A0A9P3UND7_LYOSH|nr:putative cytosolic domain of 10TM putative phosphate transporter [Lyophyllum shimeji]
MSGISDEAGQIFNDNSRTLAPAAVASQVALMSVVSIVTILAFNLLRPNNKIIYEPKVKYHVGNKPPPRISDSVFGWLPPLVNTKEPELLDKLGLDAVAYLRFNRLMRWLFTGIAALTCAVLLPINITYNLRNVPTKKRDILSMLTIRDVGGNLLYAHVAVTYLITLMIIAFVEIHWRAMVKLRHAWFRSPEYLESFYARTLTVRRVPKKNQSDEGLKAVFESTKVPYPTTSVHIGRKVGKLPDLIEYHNTTVREFEAVLVKYLKGGKLGRKRPTIRVGGTCGMGGMKKDAIDHYTAKLQRTEAAIEEYRRQIDTRKAENYGFASMAAVPYAHIVAKMLRGKRPKGTKIELAPNPKDIIWENMNKSEGELARKKAIGFVWLAVVCFFNTVPLFIISILANLESLRVYVHFLDSWATASPKSFAIVSGVLPPTVSGIFGFFLPIIMRWLTQYMGALTHSRLDRAVIARYYTFLVISQLVIFTLIGVIFNSVKEIVEQIGRKASAKEIIENLHTLPQTVHRTYINQASYWLTFFPLRGFLVIFDLAQIINLVWISFKTHVFGRTPRDIREWTQPPEFQYAIYYSNILFMGAVGLVFAPLAPLVAVAAAAVFWIGSWVYKYQLMFVFISKVESGGRLWNVAINRLLFSVFLMQLLMVLTIGLQYRFRSLQWLSTIPPLLFVLAYKIYINRVHLPIFQYFIPTEEEIRVARVHSQRADARHDRLGRRFGHPALHAELFTPMLHAKMMPLLSQVYHGKIGKDEAKLSEYGGQKLEAQVVPGGIKIAAISQNDLEYDPTLYQRDRGELDWDARSMASTVMYDGPESAKSPYQHGSSPSVSKLPGYDRYLTGGPQHHHQHSDIELSKLDSMQEPLLDPRSFEYYQQQQGVVSQQSLMLNIPPLMYQDPLGSTREAPTHRPQERSYSPSPAYSSPVYSPAQSPEPQYQPYQQAPMYSPAQQYPPVRQPSPFVQHSRQNSSNNLAGRGAHRA